MQAKQRLTQLRNSVPREQVANYAFEAGDGTRVTLRELFGERRDLLVIHNMGSSCAYCALWADGINGMLHHLKERTAVVLESPDAPDVQARVAVQRGWKFRMVSSRGTDFKRDLGFEDESGAVLPGVSAFYVEDDGTITRVNRAPFGPGDDFCSVWPLFELLADGPAGWRPR